MTESLRMPPDELELVKGLALKVSPDLEFTPEQIAEFKAALDEATAHGSQVRIRPLDRLTLDQVRQVLSECVTVVKPGETLILRVGNGYTPVQVREMQEALNAGWGTGDPYWPFRTLVVPGDELGIVQAPGVRPLCDMARDGVCPAAPCPACDRCMYHHGRECPAVARASR